MDHAVLAVHGYEIIDLLGSGGYANVYKVKSEKYGKYFAAKVINVENDNPSLLASFEAEIKTLQMLYHPNIILMYDYFRDKGKLYQILEYCEGGSMLDMINRGASCDELMFIYENIAKAVEFCHQNNISHGDIKPANILLDSHGRAKLADFGLARLLGSSVDKVHGNACSLCYAPPELIRGDKYSPIIGDVWSMGILFYQIIVGQLPWSCSTIVDLKRQILYGSITFPSYGPDQRNLYTLMKKMLECEPERRITMQNVNQYFVKNTTNSPQARKRNSQKWNKSRRMSSPLNRSMDMILGIKKRPVCARLTKNGSVSFFPNLEEESVNEPALIA